MLQKIQKAGKNLVLLPHVDEVVPLLDNLSCCGLLMIIWGLRTNDEARDLLKLIGKHSKDRTL